MSDPLPLDAPDADAPSPWTLRPRGLLAPLEPGDSDRRWCSRELDATELRQIAEEVLGLSVAESRALLLGTRADLRRAGRAELVDAPVEWWDILQGVALVGRLYLFMVDAGVLYLPADAPQPTPEGVIQGCWHGDADVGARLAEAAEALKESGHAPESLIHHVRFRARRARRALPLDQLRRAAARMTKG